MMYALEYTKVILSSGGVVFVCFALGRDLL